MVRRDRLIYIASPDRTRSYFLRDPSTFHRMKALLLYRRCRHLCMTLRSDMTSTLWIHAYQALDRKPKTALVIGSLCPLSSSRSCVHKNLMSHSGSSRKWISSVFIWFCRMDLGLIDTCMSVIEDAVLNYVEPIDSLLPLKSSPAGRFEIKELAMAVHYA